MVGSHGRYDVPSPLVAVHVGDGAAGATGDQARGVPHLEGRHHRQLRRAQRRGAGGALETQRVAPLLAPRLRRSDKVKYLSDSQCAHLTNQI